MLKAEGLVKNHITYMKHIKNTVMKHGCHIYAKAYDMTKSKMCTYPQSDHALPHWKRVLRCCADCPCISIPDQETTKKHEETIPSIRFHIYHIIGRCTAHGRIHLKDKKYVTCVNNHIHQITLQKYTPEKS